MKLSAGLNCLPSFKLINEAVKLSDLRSWESEQIKTRAVSAAVIESGEEMKVLSHSSGSFLKA